MAEEQVILVDASDQPLGLMNKLEAHEKGVLHRAFSVYLVRQRDGQWEFLMQQRAHEKYHCGGMWTNTCCSHQREGEDSIQAGKRRLKEEMGIEAELMELDCFTYRAEFENGLTEHEYDHVLFGQFEQDDIPFNPEEVASVRWMNLEQIYKDSAAHPEQYTPWFKLALNVVRKHLTQIEQKV